MDFTAGQHKQAGLTYSPLKALIAPRPIGWISSLSPSGVANLAPYSFFNAVAELPPMVMFISAPDMREDRPDTAKFAKDSLQNILDTKEFGVNITSADQLDQMVLSSRPVAAGVDEFELAGLEKKQAKTIKAPLVEGAPAHLECHYYDHINLPDNGKGQHSIMVLGHITHIHIDDRAIKDGRVDVSVFRPVSRLGYRDYDLVTDPFEVPEHG